MASFEDLQFDWSMLCQDCTECWTPSGLHSFLFFFIVLRMLITKSYAIRTLRPRLDFN